ncbi:LLM class F420-dependent oxidoreductase [Actinomycetospora sp. NBRC 106375]|uniref:LLM class F420-dependent oxidoreductase n=1 Tax=Actinomycetospora sp. NBRC 106375 TaxID=3032207 RepID=UPI00255414BE|nr:LLM class F420-dependent oxidoreductase [Actinomycetospora sp. NBRC 106375]
MTDDGVDPRTLARAAEQRGFHSVFLTEHTHIPASRTTPWPGGDVLPGAYSRLLDPFSALTAMATVTEELVLGTGVCLVNQHHPITLAKQVATVDLLSDGRFEFGVGAGWNREEMVNHDVDPARRTAAMLERIDAVRTIWTRDEPEYHGEFVDFDPIWSWPKPARSPAVLLGGSGRGVLERVLSHGDGWMPTRVRLSEIDAFSTRVAEFRRMCATRGRGHLPVIVFDAVAGREALAMYSEAGVDRVLFSLTADNAATERGCLEELDALASILDR